MFLLMIMTTVLGTILWWARRFVLGRGQPERMFPDFLESPKLLREMKFDRVSWAIVSHSLPFTIYNASNVYKCLYIN